MLVSLKDVICLDLLKMILDDIMCGGVIFSFNSIKNFKGLKSVFNEIFFFMYLFSVLGNDCEFLVIFFYLLKKKKIKIFYFLIFVFIF